jgi:hypothetical protein
MTMTLKMAAATLLVGAALALAHGPSFPPDPWCGRIQTQAVPVRPTPKPVPIVFCVQNPPFCVDITIGR